MLRCRDSRSWRAWNHARLSGWRPIVRCRGGLSEGRILRAMERIAARSRHRRLRHHSGRGGGRPPVRSSSTIRNSKPQLRAREPCTGTRRARHAECSPGGESRLSDCASNIARKARRPHCRFRGCRRQRPCSLKPSRRSRIRRRSCFRRAESEPGRRGDGVNIPGFSGGDRTDLNFPKAGKAHRSGDRDRQARGGGARPAAALSRRTTLPRTPPR